MNHRSILLSAAALLLLSLGASAAGKARTGVIKSIKAHKPAVGVPTYEGTIAPDGGSKEDRFLIVGGKVDLSKAKAGSRVEYHMMRRQGWGDTTYLADITKLLGDKPAQPQAAPKSPAAP